MATKITILLIIGLLGSAVFILFVNNRKVKLIIATLILSAYLAMLTLGVFTSGTHFSNLRIDFTGKWASKDIIWSPIPESSWGFFINIIMLIPVGIYMGAFVEKPLWKSALVGLGTGFFIELMQFILPIERYPQVSDVWLNAVSVVIGCLYAMCLVWIKNKFLTKKQPKEIEIANNENITENVEKEETTDSNPQTTDKPQKQENLELTTTKKEEKKKQKTSK